MDNQLTSTELTTADNRAISHLKQAIAGGKHWYIALLEAIALWSSAEESYQGRRYRYLIDGEAFDWLLLAERLCREVESLLPEEERIALLFHGQPPVKLTAQEFKKLIGGGKYHQYLNYFYGVTVEEALVLAVQEEVRKEKRLSGYAGEQNLANEAYRRIYGATRAILLKRFRREKRYPQLKSASLAELKEFSYWLFKYRLKQCDKARVASDTKKALERLGANGSPPGAGNYRA
jgi:hypothetical protein